VKTGVDIMEKEKENQHSRCRVYNCSPMIGEFEEAVQEQFGEHWIVQMDPQGKISLHLAQTMYEEDERQVIDELGKDVLTLMQEDGCDDRIDSMLCSMILRETIGEVKLEHVKQGLIEYEWFKNGNCETPEMERALKKLSNFGEDQRDKLVRLCLSHFRTSLEK
jgi:hypothetical protein